MRKRRYLIGQKAKMGFVLKKNYLLRKKQKDFSNFKRGSQKRDIFAFVMQ